MIQHIIDYWITLKSCASMARVVLFCVNGCYAWNVKCLLWMKKKIEKFGAPGAEIWLWMGHSPWVRSGWVSVFFFQSQPSLFSPHRNDKKNQEKICCALIPWVGTLFIIKRFFWVDLSPSVAGLLTRAKVVLLMFSTNSSQSLPSCCCWLLAHTRVACPTRPGCWLNFSTCNKSTSLFDIYIVTAQRQSILFKVRSRKVYGINVYCRKVEKQVSTTKGSFQLQDCSLSLPPREPAHFFSIFQYFIFLCFCLNFISELFVWTFVFFSVFWYYFLFSINNIWRKKFTFIHCLQDWDGRQSILKFLPFSLDNNELQKTVLFGNFS